MVHKSCFVAAALMFAATLQVSLAQSYPVRAIKFIVPYPPGGGNDDVARMLGKKISDSMGQPVVVENKAGASGMIAGDYLAKSVPDGYTIMIDHSSIVINPALYPNISYSVVKDLSPITLAASQSNILITHPSVQARSLAELVKLAKAMPGKLNYASPGNGTPQHVGMELLKQMSGTQITHIPYKGGGPATLALVAGEVDMLLTGTTGLPHIKSGRAVALATTGNSRSLVLPEVPTVAQSGINGYVNVNWVGIFAPAGTPPQIIARLNTEFVKALKTPDIQKQLNEKNYDVVASTPDEFKKVIGDGLNDYQKLIKAAGITAD